MGIAELSGGVVKSAKLSKALQLFFIQFLHTRVYKGQWSKLAPVCLRLK
jgi:hypothetical protein